MSRLPFQTVPAHFSINGSSTQRIQHRRQVERHQPQPEQRSIRSPHKSRWHMAADLVIMQMVLMRQVHPERPELCWQGIADALVHRGYLEAGLTAGSVKSRFVSLMHKCFQPDALNLPKLYDRIAILFHDEPIPELKKQSTKSDCHDGKSSTPILSTDCAESALGQKATALQLVDRAYLAAQCDEALGVHRTQRPDIVAQRRHNEFLQSQKFQSTHDAAKVEVVHTQLQANTQLPTPTATSELSQVDSTHQSAIFDRVQLTDGQWTDEDKPLQGHLTTTVLQSHGKMSQISRSSRKRARSQGSSDCPKPSKSVRLSLGHESSQPKQEVQQDFLTILKTESLGAVNRRQEAARKLEERKTRGAAGTSGRLRFVKYDYRHPNRKLEKCWVFERMLELREAAKFEVNTSTVVSPAEDERDSLDQSKSRTLKSTQDGVKPRRQHGDIKRNERISNETGTSEPKKLKNPRIHRVQRQHEYLLSSPSGSDGERSNRKSNRKRSSPTRLEALTQRVKAKKNTKRTATPSLVTEVHESSKPIPDIVGALWGGILKSRQKKNAIVDARAAARAAQLARTGHIARSAYAARTVRF